MKAETESVGLEAPIHADLTQTCPPNKPEKRQQLQPRMQLKTMPLPRPNPIPIPKLNTVTAPALT